MNQVEYKYRKVIEYLQLHGPTSKSQIARALNTSFMTVNTIVNRIHAQDLVTVCGKSYGSSGRSPELFKLRPELLAALGVAIRAEKIVLSVVDTGGRMTAQGVFPVLDPEVVRSSRQLSPFLLHSIRSFLMDKIPEQGRVAVAGITIDGVIDHEEGVARQIVNNRVNEFHLRSELQDQLGFPVVVEDTARAQGYMSWKSMNGLRPRSLLFLRCDSEVGCGMVIEGRVYRGNAGFAGKVGHLRVGDSDAKCRCGATGCLEAVASSSSVLARARSLAEEGRWVIGDGGAGADSITMQTLRRSAENGDQAARELIRSCAEHLGTALLWLVHAYNPELVLMGGEVCLLGKYLIDGIESQVRDYLSSSSQHMLRFSPVDYTENGDSAAAAVYALDRLFEVGPDLESPPPIQSVLVADLVEKLMP